MGGQKARFNGMCIVTDSVAALRDFYQLALDVEAEGDEAHSRLLVEGAELTLFTKSGMESMAPGSMEGAGTGQYTIEIEVGDVDRQYQRLTDLGVVCIKTPTTYPWGRRSAWFRDPDGNILNLFSHISKGT